MPKDSQPDHKKARAEKANAQPPVPKENQNQSHNTKKQSLGPNTRRS